MGFRVLLLAVTGKPVEQVHHDLNVSPTGQREEVAESPVVGAMLSNGAYLVYINDEIVPEPKLLSRLSENAEVATCYVNETDMKSFASFWHSGIEKWTVFHDAQVAQDDLKTSGHLPNQFSAIRERLTDEQLNDSAVDYIFDVPVELFVSLGGLQYGRDPDVESHSDEPWEILERT